MPEEESAWLSTETIPNINNAAVTGSVKRGVGTILTKFFEFVLRDSVLEVTLGLMYVRSHCSLTFL